MTVVMEALNDIESIPAWAIVSGTIDNIQGNDSGMTYEWHYNINSLSFDGESEVVGQTETTLITKTTGDIDSIWTINLTPVGKKITVLRVVVEYSPPNIFMEILADIVLQQLNDPEVAKENIMRFKEMVEERARVIEKQVMANQ